MDNETTVSYGDDSRGSTTQSEARAVSSSNVDSDIVALERMFSDFSKSVFETQKRIKTVQSRLQKTGITPLSSPANATNKSSPDYLSTASKSSSPSSCSSSTSRTRLMQKLQLAEERARKAEEEKMEITQRADNERKELEEEISNLKDKVYSLRAQLIGSNGGRSGNGSSVSGYPSPEGAGMKGDETHPIKVRTSPSSVVDTEAACSLNFDEILKPQARMLPTSDEMDKDLQLKAASINLFAARNSSAEILKQYTLEMDALTNTIQEKDQRIAELESELGSARKLVNKWQTQNEETVSQLRSDVMLLQFESEEHKVQVQHFQELFDRLKVSSVLPSDQVSEGGDGDDDDDCELESCDGIES
jgi:multidrug efflux pump subunit AcrA (membrane-fusion protein)